MSKIIKEYANGNNGGRERITRVGDQFSINSYLPMVGWMGERKVSREQAKSGMSYTNAPADVIAAILQ